MDIQYLLMLQRFREATGGILDPVFMMFTKAGQDFAVLFTFAFFWSISKEIGLHTMFGYYFGRFLNGILKLAACVYRPWIRSDAVHPLKAAIGGATGYSFPSGHSTSATGAFGTVAWDFRRKRKMITIVLMVLVFLVMFSRNYAGVHTPQDVLVGFAATFLMILLTGWLLSWVEKGENRDLLLVLIVICAGLAAIYWFLHKSYPMDYDEAGKLIVDPVKMIPDSFAGAGAIIGLMIGWIIERRYIKFTTDITVLRKIVRFAAGAVMFLGLKQCLGEILKVVGIQAYWNSFFKNLILLLFCTVVYPWMFTFIEKTIDKKKEQVGS